MPYIDKHQRPLFVELIRGAKEYPAWKNPEEHAVIMEMIFSWLEVKAKENPLKVDGYINFICTTMLKHTHRTYHTPDEHKTKIFNTFDKEVALFVREIFSKIFETSPSYSSYERLYGLLCLMEAEFARRGWSNGRIDLSNFFKKEKRYWLKRIADYEDLKIKENGDVD